MTSKALNLAKFFKPTTDGKIDPKLLDFSGTGMSDGTNIVSNISDLGIGAEGLSSYVASTKSLYLHDGNDWKRVSNGINSAPVFITDQPPDNFSLNIVGETMVMKATAVDPEYDSAVFPITYSYEITDEDSNTHTPLSGTLPSQITNIAEGYQTTGMFEFTASNVLADYGTFVLKITANDGSATAEKIVNVALENTGPSAITGVNSQYSLSQDGTTPTIITASSTDFEGQALTWSYAVTSGSLNGTTVSNVDNVFTITPHPTNETSFGLTISVTDGTNTTTKDVSIDLLFTASVQYLIVAGGGGGGDDYSGGSYSWKRTGGGGGAGEVVAGTTDVLTGVFKTVTVGNGGAYNADGNNSVFDSITAYKGGKGGGLSFTTGGTAYGSTGGGGGIEYSGHSSASNNIHYQTSKNPNTWPNPTGGIRYRNAGGDGGTYHSYQRGGMGGGGGGAGSAGSVGTLVGNYTNGYGGAGGNGIANSITGTSVTYGGGGGGYGGRVKMHDPGDPNFIYSYGSANGRGGTGGGGGGSGAGGGTVPSGSGAVRNGTNGLGGGGGGGGGISNLGGSTRVGGDGGTGGRGVVILRCASSVPVITTGSVTTTTVGSDKVYKFTYGSGTIKFG